MTLTSPLDSSDGAATDTLGETARDLHTIWTQAGDAA